VIERGIRDVVILERETKNITFGYLVNLQTNFQSDSHTVPSPVYARVYEDELKEALEHAKAFLMGNREFDELPSSYKL